MERRWSHDPTPDYPEKILAALTESGYAVIESNLVVGELPAAAVTHESASRGACRSGTGDGSIRSTIVRRGRRSDSPRCSRCDLPLLVVE